jgi:hypothetical protein
MAKPVHARDSESFSAPVARVETTIELPGSPPMHYASHPGDRFAATETALPQGHPITFHLEHVQFRIPPAARQRTELDAGGRLRRVEFLADDGAIVSVIEAEVDEAGRYVRAVQTVGDDVLAELRKSYDDAARVITSTLTLAGMVVSERRQLVGEHDLVVSEEDTGPDGVTRRSRMEYVFNERGDWIELTVFAEGRDEPVSRTRREIVYRES